MMFDRSDKGAKSLDSRWVEKAGQAKQSTMSLNDWSQREIERWDLDDPVREPTGAKNPRTWTYGKPLRRVNQDADRDGRVDARESRSIRDGDADGPLEGKR